MGLPENFIPEGQLPQCWSDDVRMNALFAPFRLKAANPESWEMKMKFWSDMLRLWCKCRQDPIVSASDAKFAFQRKGRTPACIDIVIEEMFRNGDLAPISKYHQILHNGPEGWVRWGARLAFKPAAFALSAVTSLLPARQATDNDGLPKASIDSTQRFVLECAVKDQATDFLNNYPPGLERIGTVDELMRNSGWLGTREVFELVLGYLVSQGSAVKKDEVVKIAEPNKKATPVTDTDEALVKLMAAETRLETDAERLALDAAAADTEARAALQLGNRIAAKNHLCRKHKFLIRSDRCTAVLDNVRQLLHQMRDVSVNAAVLDTYRTSSEAMKREMKQSGLEEDAVHDTLDDLKEVMDSYSEIEKALGATSDEDMEDLEAELKELLSTPGAGGGTPGKTRAPEAKVPVLPSPPGGRPARRDLDREGDFVFDGEERVLAELTELADEATPKGKAKPQKSDLPKPQPKSLPMKPWYPPSAQCLSPAEPWNNNYGFPELRQDERLHPGQPLKVDFTTPPRHYCDDFQVKDHKMASGVWLYNTKDSNSNVGSDLATSTEYFRSITVIICSAARSVELKLNCSIVKFVYEFTIEQFNYSTTTEGGIFHEQRGSLQPSSSGEPALVVEGQYQYVAPDGQVINLLYKADENGFQPTGAHLPTPPPIPPAIQRALDYLATKRPPTGDNDY